jgi:hypothetical protein
MTPALLRQAGEALYGARWQSDLARDLKVADRTIRRWDSGSHPMPNGLGKELRALLKARSIAIAAVRRQLPRSV